MKRQDTQKNCGSKILDPMMIETITYIVIAVLYGVISKYIENAHYLVFMAVLAAFIHYWGKDKYGCGIVVDCYSSGDDELDDGDSTGEDVKVI